VLNLNLRGSVTGVQVRRFLARRICEFGFTGLY
jgi:hypothetical protein